MAYQKLQVYYFSGTGNAYTAAKWTEESGRKENVLTEIHSIEEKGSLYPLASEGRSLIVFSFPTHGFAPPWIMLKFMWLFPRLKNTDVLFINTKAGFKLWKFYIPGMTGLAQWLPALIFRIKGYRIAGLLPLDMPHSWVSFFPPNPTSMYPPMLDRCHRIVNTMCAAVFTGKIYFRYTVWTQLWFDLLVAWITPLYLFIGRFFLAKTLFSSYKCNSCRLCEINCPVNAIEMKGGMPYWNYKCESCMRCMNLCPQKSIQSWITRIALVFYLLVTAGITLTQVNYHLITLTATLLFFPIYWMLIKALHVKFINVLFTYTSFTRYWGRAFAPGVKAKDLKGKS